MTFKLFLCSLNKKSIKSNIRICFCTFQFYMTKYDQLTIFGRGWWWHFDRVAVRLLNCLIYLQQRTDDFWLVSGYWLVFIFIWLFTVPSCLQCYCSFWFGRYFIVSYGTKSWVVGVDSGEGRGGERREGLRVWLWLSKGEKGVC